jgi:hypothetical protein
MFADDAGTPIFKVLTAPSQAAQLAFVCLVAFIVAMLAFAIIMLLLQRKVGKAPKKKPLRLP